MGIPYKFTIPEYNYGTLSGNPHTETYRMLLFRQHKDIIINKIKQDSPPMNDRQYISLRRKFHQYYSQLIMSIITNRTYSEEWRPQIQLEDGMFNTPTLDETRQFYADLNFALSGFGFNLVYSADCFNIVSSIKDIIHKMMEYNPPQPQYTRIEDRTRVTYKFQSDTISIPKNTYIKCVKAYTGKDNVDTSILCCLLRYKTLNSGANQFVVDLRYKEALRKTAGFDFECFGSVFNRYYTHYCSMFYDLERDFGSCGSFMALHIDAGYYMANPPYDENLLNKMYACVKQALRGNVVILMSIPLWTDYELEGRIDTEHLYREKQIREEKFHTDMDPSVMVPIPKYINYLFTNTTNDIHNFLEFYSKFGKKIK